MKENYQKQRRMAAAMVSALALMWGAGVQAQGPQGIAVADVPFAFHYGDQVFPAGHYKLTLDSPHLLRLQGDRLSAYLSVRDEDRLPTQVPARLTFRAGERGELQLREVWAPMHDRHLVSTVRQARKRKISEPQLASKDSPVQVVLAEAGQ